MKNSTLKFLLALLFISLTFIGFSQSPNAIKYQAAVRDGTAELVSNQNVGFQIKIHNASLSGSVIYTESHTATTNQFGIANLEIGNGSTSDDFGNIDWSDNEKYIEVLIDISGGSSYMSMGAFQLLSVPFSLYANKAGDVSDNAITLNKISENGASNGQVIMYNGTDISWATPATSNGNTLDEAYDEGGSGAGRTIVANAGAVHISGSDGLNVDGGISVGTAIENNNDSIKFNHSSSPESIIWKNSQTKFQVSDDLSVQGTISNGDSTHSYNSIVLNNDAEPESIEMGSKGDLFVEYDLEVGDDFIVYGRMMGNVPGISQGRVNGTVIINHVSPMEDLVTTTITIPAAGYIVVEASGQFSYSGTTGTNLISQQIDETAGGTISVNYYQYNGASSPANTSAVYSSASNRRTYYKPAGTYTFRWEAYASLITGNRYMWNPVITATFIPTSHGAVGTSIPASEASNISSKVLIKPTNQEGDLSNNVSEKTFQVDLREFENKVSFIEKSQVEK